MSVLSVYSRIFIMTRIRGIGSYNAWWVVAFIASSVSHDALCQHSTHNMLAALTPSSLTLRHRLQCTVIIIIDGPPTASPASVNN